MDEPAYRQPEGVPLRLDPEAESADPSLPAFLARPDGAPVFHGFPLLESSMSDDGWCFGTISDPDCPEGRDWGDAFVVAPNGSRAGIIWEVREPTMEVCIEPERDLWGCTISRSPFGSIWEFSDARCGVSSTEEHPQYLLGFDVVLTRADLFALQTGCRRNRTPATGGRAEIQ
jgi:hypothetical protein